MDTGTLVTRCVCSLHGKQRQAQRALVHAAGTAAALIPDPPATLNIDTVISTTVTVYRLIHSTDFAHSVTLNETKQ